MFHTSTQRKHWIFINQEEVQKLRENVNSAYKSRHSDAYPDKKNVKYLTVEEEKKLVEYYELVIVEVSAKFQPPVPRSVTATAITYLKRFYVKTSVMDHPPKEMFLVCLFMACKVEEYNISVENFVQILPRDRREKVMDFILAHELLLMERLDFHLTIHHPFRPMEGFLIDIKMYLSEGKVNPESWRIKAEEFLLRAMRTDVAFHFSPSQIALAALSVGSTGGELQKYVNEKFGVTDKGTALMDTINSIVNMVTSHIVTVTKDQVKALESKLKTCRNPENNPDSKMFKRRTSGNDENQVEQMEIESP
ncbi:cyclin-H [Nematostella vectensis]|uniref:cyclin-H n=1 Tax=Nematostella vectensis TaxID=45351 RepID=UPI0020775F4D|nr:cyclin-H [Nematostella vectensis]